MIDNIYLKNFSGCNCLHIAAEYGHMNLCQKLLEKYNFDINLTDNDGWTPLHFSIKNGSHELFQYFLVHGSNIYLKTRDGSNCLHIAASNGHLNLCKKLVEEHDFKVKVTDDNWWAPLHCAGRSGNYELFLYFLNKGSEIYCKTKHDGNVVHIAALFGHVDICEYVLNQFTKDFESNNKNKQYALDGELYDNKIFFKYDIIFLHAKNEDLDSYLHCAARGKHAKVCELLLNYDIDVTWLNAKDETARDIATQNKDEEILEVLKSKYERAGMLFAQICQNCFFHLQCLYYTTQQIFTC